MDSFALLIDFCYRIMNIPINLFGYSISIWHLFIFGGLVYIIVWLFFGIMK